MEYIRMKNFVVVRYDGMIMIISSNENIIDLNSRN